MYDRSPSAAKKFQLPILSPRWNLPSVIDNPFFLNWEVPRTVSLWLCCGYCSEVYYWHSRQIYQGNWQHTSLLFTGFGAQIFITGTSTRWLLRNCTENQKCVYVDEWVRSFVFRCSKNQPFALCPVEKGHCIADCRRCSTRYCSILAAGSGFVSQLCERVSCISSSNRHWNVG